jgi:glycerate kinase
VTANRTVHPTVAKRILIAPDSFKGSLTALEAASAIERGVLQAIPDATVFKHPISDGGEGLVNVVMPVLGGRIVTTEVSGPLPDQRVDARWGLSADGSTAIIEMAEASGLLLVPPERRDPKITTTYGVGELIAAALDAGVTSIVVGIGGSATNDGGAGMAEALGARFLDASGNPITRGGAALMDLAQIDCEGIHPRLGNVEVLVACDVQNTLCGSQGASAVYGPQKGARLSDVSLLDKALEHYGRSILSQMDTDVITVPGGGAAGGLGAGLVAFCGGTLMRGIELVFRVTKFDERIRESDLVITGEGKIDRQTKYGKALSGVIERAHRFKVPVVAVVGRLEGERTSFVNNESFADLETLVDSQTTEADAIRNASRLLPEKTKLLIQRYLSRT